MCMVVFDGRFGKTFCGLSDHKFVKCPFMDSVVCGMRFILRFIVRPPASLSLGGERRRSKILMKTRKNP